MEYGKICYAIAGEGNAFKDGEPIKFLGASNVSDIFWFRSVNTFCINLLNREEFTTENPAANEQ